MLNAIEREPVAEGQISLVLRLNLANSSPYAEGVEKLRWYAQTLIKDILLSNLRLEIEDAGQYLRAQGVSNFGKALATSRTLQCAMDGFRNAFPSTQANLSIVLDSSTLEDLPADYTSNSSNLFCDLGELLEAVRPSQVLITQAFYDRVAHCRPLRLRAFASRTGVYEFLWTDEVQADETQERTYSASTLIGGQTPGPSKAPSFGSQMDRDFSEPFSPDEPTQLYSRRDLVFTDLALAEPRSGRRIFAIGSAAALLIGLSYLAFLYPGRDAWVERLATTFYPLAKLEIDPPTPPLGIKDFPRTGGVERPAKPVRTARCPEPEIQSYLELAEASRNGGHYQDAERQFGEALECDPSNRQALQGLRFTKLVERNQ
jgi:tetratricopeptide (TPR) repeat protein